MPKDKTTYAYNIQSIVNQFPDEFMESINNQLYCNLCKCAVSCNKRFLVDSHRNTSKYQKALGSRSENLIPQTSQTFLRISDTDFVEKVTKAFLFADIPLYKLNNTHMKNLFRDIGHRLPSETTCRQTALQLSENELKQIRNAVHDKKVFLIVDERSARNLGINRSFFCLLLSDAAKYMIAVCITLKSLYLKLFHVTCVAHLLCNCAMKIKSYFEDVDQLIAKVKAVTIKNKTREAKFSATGYPPQYVRTRRGSWLNAVVYYKKILLKVKAIVVL